jgi:hypothetical protein
MERGVLSVKHAYFPLAIIGLALAAGIAMAQPERDFSGSWRLDPARSNINNLNGTGTAVGAEPSFRVEQSASSITITAASQDGGPASVSIYPLDGRSEKYQTGNLLKNTATKWEGDALLVNTIVSVVDTASGNFSIAERW